MGFDADEIEARDLLEWVAAAGFTLTALRIEPEGKSAAVTGLVAPVADDEDDPGIGEIGRHGVELAPMAGRLLTAMRLVAAFRIECEDCGQHFARCLAPAAPRYHSFRRQPKLGQAIPAGENVV